MIQYIKGMLTYKNESFIVVENNGMGYKVFVPSNSIFYTKSEGEELTVFTVMIFKEDDPENYNFFVRRYEYTRNPKKSKMLIQKNHDQWVAQWEQLKEEL